ncbi:related to dehydrogenases with different specificities (related to short-chain alcohol dehydrogenases) [Ramularia collo-cygni]|uniref:Related to dehydrogenases with different specificities (Related to short-chain alcohol dehydrogenases) n=1 Tax=Ramularia collo-cygni TaxID=112498 RepID=A0A2D3VBV1_9PEZI|nr:related to dehydrogenases with different specificities (related to short-chain alcohol dehydrogenases) [Ramularia collo-cygni]CZT21176.1 related to dehydrogenases with different specificities (related to short-chain alcohol dehydrogenases) [Ramularia collo-cygni]
MAIFDYTNKVVLLTGIGAVGEGYGNGSAMAAAMARQGATVYGCDINLAAANTAAEQIMKEEEVKSRGNQVEVFQQPTDVTKKDACKAFVEACLAKHGRIDVLVNNVGKSEPGGPAEMTEEVWDAQMDVNLKSVYLMCNLVLPIMEKQSTGGCVLNVASIAGLRYIGKPQVAYAATKAAVIHFTKTTAVIYAQRTGGKVRLNTIVPGLINSPLVSVLANKYAGGDQEGYRKVRDKQSPTGKMGSVWDVAHGALYLCSSEASYVTGQELVIDGGVVDSTGHP